MYVASTVHRVVKISAHLRSLGSLTRRRPSVKIQDMMSSESMLAAEGIDLPFLGPQGPHHWRISPWC